MELINNQLKKKFENFPLLSQEGKGYDAECIAKYFMGNCTWLITEAEPRNDDYVMFGYCDRGLGSPEWGYVLLSELEAISDPFFGFKVERDLYASGRTVGELCESLGLEYPKEDD